MNNDASLLGRFADHGAQDAFAELARQKVNLVYAAALRQVGGDAHLAQDVTQAVFLALASQAGALRHHVMLTGWLYTTTRFIALNAVRTQARWQRREQAANIMSATSRTAGPAWEELRPVIDEAMHRLGEKDRAALLLRFFEGKSLADVGAELGLAENAARMRVERALEKLRTRLARRGITSAAAALGAALSAQPAVVAPVGLVASLTTGALAVAAGASGGAAGVASGLGYFMGANKIILGTTCLLAALGLGAFLGVQLQAPPTSAAANARATIGTDDSALEVLRSENIRLKAELARGAERRSATPAVATGTPLLSAVDQLRVLADLSKRRLLHPVLTIFKHREPGAFSPAFVELFAITEAEPHALQRVVDRSRERLAGLERDNASVERAANGDAVVTIRPFAQAGGAVYDELFKSFAATLGPERQNAFLVLGAKDMEKSLGWLGAAERTLTFSQVATPGGDTQFKAQAHHKLPTESGSQGASFKTFEEMAAWAGTAAQLLPKDFPRGK